MLPTLALGLALLQEEGALFRENFFAGPLGARTLRIATPTERLKQPKVSPKQGWTFDWTDGGYVKSDTGYGLRFNVYSQESTQTSARPESVTRTLLQLFSYNYSKLGLDHADDFDRIVSVYLCYGGDPGGEQLFDAEKELRFVGRKVNTIYFYDLRSFNDPVETTREVAHEYGHATLPPVGGFTDPEDWANGMLGEKLYMSYLAEARKTGTLGAEDTFGASAAALGAWVQKNVDPLVEDAALKGPRAFGKDKAGMDAFLGLALWTGRLYGVRAMTRALSFSMDPKEFATSAVTVAEEASVTTINVPASLAGKTIWVPVGNKKEARISGADEIEERKAGWAHLRLRAGVKPVVVRKG